MAEAVDDFAAWLDQADIPPSGRTPELDALLQAVFRFRQQQGTDYYSTRLLSHFLLHCDTGLKVAHIARLLGISRPNASKQQKLSSKEAIKQAHHRMDGRPTGKLLPRFAGPIAAYLVGHPDASRAAVLDFIKRTFAVQVSRIALYKFLKKYGLQDVQGQVQPTTQADPALDAALEVLHSSAAAVPAPEDVASAPDVAPAPLGEADPVIAESLPAPATAQAPLALPAPQDPATPAPVFVPVLPPAPPFCSDGRNTPAPSCFSVMPSIG
jgi:hypothetical protein